ncbi:single-stranded-DNA-specific exonuclease RecJ [Paenibacillus macerans]|uniref:single-stranded-DNA-specific exonuclease RecJ n=1 Tax=Paenibacillus macerans TaxID=44252 RepID=UPI001B0B83CB|nr:single-stranded-DNA-specific exonuclease RecJ [Paenibacillus macerans]MBS5911966.1 single-stranded-DNA-specific exonuclease RecJ [Paenibacillus macerans]GIP12096.1 single-stranded-DNA-specific exonuclease RecJ [Paenibacillus macerans]
MLHPKYRWDPLPADEEAARLLADRLNLSPLVASLLVTRGMAKPEEAELFLKGTVADQHDPMQLSGMKEAVPRIRRAVENGERILVYGDYDADGVSSTTLMICLMRKLGATYEYYIPHRTKEGYGLHIPVLEQARQKGVTLVVTVDTGISAVEQIAYAREAGMDVIVTDHHEPPAVLPEAYALINPKLPFCPYPFKGLAGVGVAFKLAKALLGDDTPECWTELVALGTIADLMPLVGENRMLVRAGLVAMSRSAFPGMTALLGTAGWSKGEVTSTAVAFGLAPRINASGRMSHADRAVALLTAENADEAETIAEELDVLNKERQMLVESMVQEALLQLEEQTGDAGLPNIIVVAGEGWNAGVVGIVASKLLERYFRPTIVLGINPETGECKGSARSIPGFDIYEALTDCADLLDHFGGHPSAAGMSLGRGNLAEFSRRLNAFAAGKLRPEHFVPVITTDLECSLKEITLSSIEELESLAPFGMANTCPRLLIRGVKLVECRQMGKDGKHLKLVVGQNGVTVEAVAFGKGELAPLLAEEAVLDMVCEAGINEWNGSRKPQLMIQDLAVSHLQVFDYRGSRNPAMQLEQLKSTLVHLPAYERDIPAVIAAGSGPQLLQLGDLKDTSVWVYDKDDGVLPGNALAESVGASRVTTLFVLELPDASEGWSRMMAAFVSLERIYLLHPQRSPQERIETPSRDHFKQVYGLLLRLGGAALREEEIVAALLKRTGWSRRMLELTLGVFEELGFISRASGSIAVNPSPSKRPLETSSRYREFGLLAEMEQMLLHARVPEITKWMLTRIKGAS